MPGGRASVRGQGIDHGHPATHFSAPPQHAGYRSGQTGHGDGWPERGGAGPQTGPHIPGLAPRRYDPRPEPQRRPGPGRYPRAPFTGERAPVRARRRSRWNAFRPGPR